VLLGAWANALHAQKILDIGTGTGLIAIMMAQKNCVAQIDAIEIDPDAFQEAALNINSSRWKERISLELCSFQDFSVYQTKKYDLIVSNPPFFANGIKAPLKNRSQARHSDSLPIAVLISGARSMLSENGKIAMILPVESLQEIKHLAMQNALYFSRLCRVKPNPQKPVFRIMAEFSCSECAVLEEDLMIEFEKHHDYTPEYRELTNDFYLKF
jgi:tRNA1Val (adenine37-N6)-methyltransferase